MKKIALTPFLLVFLAAAALAQDAGTLRERHASVRAQLADNPFGRPLYVESRADSGAHEGQVFAELERPFQVVAPALKDIERWCDILILPANVRGCRVDEGGADTLAMLITAEPQDAIEGAFKVNFRYRLAATAGDYFRVELASAEGPFGTSDYNISLEAASLDPRRTFMHMTYSYDAGLAARLATQAYLATTGRGKVGFSVVERSQDGNPVYVQGVRGVVERNAMRYYLAIESYLGALDAPPEARLEKRFRDWYAAIGRYPRQLEERISRDDYVQLKLAEARRSQESSATGR